MLRPLLRASRYLVVPAVLASLVAATVLILYGFADSLVVIVRTIRSGEVSDTGAKALMFFFIQLFDLLLLGTVMLMMALGLYELFLDPDQKVLERLHIQSFEDLKANLVTVVIAVMAVTFLGQVMSWDGTTDLLGLGVAVALVIAALSMYLWIVKGGSK